MPSFALIGYGNRGMTYAAILKEMGERVVAVCEENEEKLQNAAALCALGKDAIFTNEDAFFAAGKLADILIIATWDRFHLNQALRAMEFGYDLILEKPIARSAEECRKIEETAERLGRRVFVCHVLRYAPFFSVLKKELDSGKYGMILRAKGIVAANDGTWIHFDFVPGEMDVRCGSAAVIGKICVIGANLDEVGVAGLFGV